MDRSNNLHNLGNCEKHIVSIDQDELDEEEIVNNGIGLNNEVLVHVQQKIQTRMQVGGIMLLCCIGQALYLLKMLSSRVPNYIPDFDPDRERRRTELMNYLISTIRCRDIIRMGPQAFILMCQKIRGTSIVKIPYGLQLKSKWQSFYI